jgi:hypothetical protein
MTMTMTIVMDPDPDLYLEVKDLEPKLDVKIKYKSHQKKN